MLYEKFEEEPSHRFIDFQKQPQVLIGLRIPYQVSIQSGFGPARTPNKKLQRHNRDRNLKKGFHFSSLFLGSGADALCPGSTAPKRTLSIINITYTAEGIGSLGLLPYSRNLVEITSRL